MRYESSFRPESKNDAPKFVLMSKDLTTDGATVDDEVTLKIESNEYFLVPHEENFLSFFNEGPTLALVYPIKPGQSISKKELLNFQTEVLEKDDIFIPSFCRNVVFYGSDETSSGIDDDAISLLQTWETKSWTFVKGTSNKQVPPGPYVSSFGRTWQPWKIYRDYNATFMCTFKPGKGQQERYVLDSPRAGINGRGIVPSRCYFKQTKSRPLDGARISIKDNIDIAGHKNTLGNRAWEDVYEPATEHAACVQTLVDAGAIIVGKAKLQAMIMREEPLEAVEFTAPFNPRADGYQVPSGSSHGSAAGIGSYNWLDYSVGSDTNGSGRKPAQYNGCFSIRPTHGIIDTRGVVSQFPEFDMPVFFSRGLAEFPNFITTWYGDSPLLRKPSDVPVKILYPLDFLPTSSKDQTALIESFIKGLEAGLNVSRSEINIAKLWAEQCPDPEEEKNKDIVEYLKLTGGYPYYHDSYANTEDFCTRYREKHGVPAFVHHYTRWQWAISEKITKEKRDCYWARSETYRKWLLEKVFDASNEACITIMVFPIEAGLPNYRDSTPAPFAILPGFNPLNTSPMAKAPELTAPLGSIPYRSVVTERAEPLPIAVSVIGAPGSDLI